MAGMSSLINSKSACNETAEIPKGSRNKTNLERKRANENELEQDEPPAEKGSVFVNSFITKDQKKSEEIQKTISEDEDDIRVLQEKNRELKTLVLIIESKLKREKEEKDKLYFSLRQLSCSEELQQQLSCSEEKSLTLSRKVQQIQANYDSIIAEVISVQKNIKQEPEEKIMKLSEKIEVATRNITSKFSQIKLIQTKIDELRSLDSVSQISNIDLLKLKTQSNGLEEENLPDIQLNLSSNNFLASKQVKEYHIQELSRESSFYSSIEAIWEACKEMVKASSKKSHKIQELQQQIEKLQAEIKGYRDEKCVLKVKHRGLENQDDLQKERENLIQQLKEERQEKNANLNVQGQLVVEGKKALSELTQDAICYKAKIKERERTLETQKEECSHLAKLEQDILVKESVILKPEENLKEFQANLNDSIKNTTDLNEKEVKLKEEITQLTSNLQDLKHSLQLKEEEKEANRQETEKLKEELSESSAVTQNLKADLGRKEEDYAELNEKPTDAKKQIEQVQKSVGYVKSCVALLRWERSFLLSRKFRC
ncbi:kinesin-like protein KIF20B [Fukomys damarensis]|uniref:kinesin-like protein KIF20B n=1 Tax=Fukomys damarensis TaxID=885580 RepID=UPI0005402435|nr:kinesin-like protein KIF20B [Fukomys damarensis]